MCAHCCYDHWSVFICIQHANIICSQPAAVISAANTNFSPILEILLANGWLGAAGQKTGPLLCVGETLRRGGGCGIVSSTYTQSLHTRSQHTLCMVAKLATYMEWPVATRLIDRLRECVLHLCSYTLPSQGWQASTGTQKGL